MKKFPIRLFFFSSIFFANFFSHLNPFYITSNNKEKFNFPLDIIKPSAELTEFAKSNPEGSVLSLDLSSEQLIFIRTLLTLLYQNDPLDSLFASIQSHQEFTNLLNTLETFKLDKVSWGEIIAVIQKKIGFAIYDYIDFFKGLAPQIRYRIGRTQNIAPLTGNQVIIARVWDQRFKVSDLTEISRTTKELLADFEGSPPEVLTLPLAPEALNALSDYLSFAWNIRLTSIREGKTFENNLLSKDEKNSIKNILNKDLRVLSYLLFAAEILEIFELKEMILELIKIKMASILNFNQALKDKDFEFLIDTIDTFPVLCNTILTTSMIKILALEDDKNAVTDVAFSPENTFLAAGITPQHIVIWDTLDFLKVADYHSSSRGYIRGLYFTNNLILASLSLMNFRGKISLFSDVAYVREKYNLKLKKSTIERIGPFKQPVLIMHAIDSYAVGKSGPNTLKVIDMSTGELYVQINTDIEISNYFFSSNKKYLIVILKNKAVYLYDFTNKNLALPVKKFEKIIYKGRISAFDISMENKMLLVGFDNGTIQLLDYKTENTIETFNVGLGKINQIIFSNDGTQMAAALSEGRILMSVPFLISYLYETHFSNQKRNLKTLFELPNKRQFEPSIKTFVPSKKSRPEYLQIIPTSKEKISVPQQPREEELSYLKQLLNKLKNLLQLSFRTNN